MTAFATSIDRLITQVGHWEQSRWWSRVETITRADLMYGLVQRLADRGADAERRPRRPVPRPTDLALPDQLRVMADDLMAAVPGDDILKIAANDVDEVRRAI